MVRTLSRVSPSDCPARYALACPRADFVLKELPASLFDGVILAELLKSVEVEGLQTVKISNAGV